MAQATLAKPSLDGYPFLSNLGTGNLLAGGAGYAH